MAAPTERTKHPGVYRVHRRSCTIRGDTDGNDPAWRGSLPRFLFGTPGTPLYQGRVSAQADRPFMAAAASPGRYPT